MLEASIPNPYTPAPLPAPADRGAQDPEETMSRDQIEALQFERLRWSLHHAYENVPAYTEHFDAHGVHPSDFKALEDLAKFPYTDKEFLRKSYPFGAFAATGPELRRIHASSGTTGQPTVVGYTDDDLATWATLVARCFRAGGIRPGDRVHNAYGYGLFTGGLGALGVDDGEQVPPDAAQLRGVEAQRVLGGEDLLAVDLEAGQRPGVGAGGQHDVAALDAAKSGKLIVGVHDRGGCPMPRARAAIGSPKATGMMQKRAQGQQGGGIQLDHDQLVRKVFDVPGAGGVHLAAVARNVFQRPRLSGPFG